MQSARKIEQRQNFPDPHCCKYRFVEINKNPPPFLPRGRRRQGRTSLNLCFCAFLCDWMFVLLVVLFSVHLRSRVSSCGCCRRATSDIRASQVSRGIFWRFGGHRELIRWRSCVDLRSAVVLFVGSCVDLRTTQGVLKESLVE